MLYLQSESVDFFQPWDQHQLCHLAGDKSGHGYSRQWSTLVGTNLRHVNRTQHSISCLNSGILVPIPCWCWILLQRSGQEVMEASWRVKGIEVKPGMSLLPEEAGERLGIFWVWVVSHPFRFSPLCVFPILSWWHQHSARHPAPGNSQLIMCTCHCQIHKNTLCAFSIRFLLEIQMPISFQQFVLVFSLTFYSYIYLFSIHTIGFLNSFQYYVCAKWETLTKNNKKNLKQRLKCFQCR